MYVPVAPSSLSDTKKTDRLYHQSQQIDVDGKFWGSQRDRLPYPISALQKNIFRKNCHFKALEVAKRKKTLLQVPTAIDGWLIFYGSIW